MVDLVGWFLCIRTFTHKTQTSSLEEGVDRFSAQTIGNLHLPEPRLNNNNNNNDNRSVQDRLSISGNTGLRA
jgi:hypothetical protein